MDSAQSELRIKRYKGFTARDLSVKLYFIDWAKTENWKAYSGVYASTYPMWQWRGRLVCGWQVGPTLSTLLSPLFSSSSLLLPTASCGRGRAERSGDESGRLRPPLAAPDPPKRPGDRGAPIPALNGPRRGREREHHGPWRTAARSILGTTAPATPMTS